MPKWIMNLSSLSAENLPSYEEDKMNDFFLGAANWPSCSTVSWGFIRGV